MTPKPRKAPPPKKATTKKKPVKSANTFGRPSLYREEYNEQAFKLCLLGHTDAELGLYFDVTETTINNWKIDHPKFFESIKEGRETADANVVKSLYRRATGYTQKVDKIFQFQGEAVIVPTVEEIAPDTGAAMAWLKNRQPQKWRDKRDVEITGKLILFAGDEDLED